MISLWPYSMLISMYPGAVHVYFGTGNSSIVLPLPDITISSPFNYSTIGITLGTGDLDGDGHSHLLIGGPYASTLPNDENVQVGVVAVFRSSTSRVAGTLSLTSADIFLEGEASFGCFGTSLLVQPLNGVTSQFPNATSLLFIGAPTWFNDNGSVGRVYVFAINGNVAVNSTMITSVTDKSKFGWKIVSGSLSPGNTVIAISAPSFGNPFLNAAQYAWEGRVYVLSLDSIPVGDVLLDDLSPISVLSGESNFCNFGWQVILSDVNGDGSDELITSLPLGAHETGQVSAYTSAGTGGVTWYIQGQQERARFGWQILALDFDGDGSMEIAVSSPRFTSTSTSMIGQVQIFDDLF
jgi:hypothetical protein